MDGRLTLSINGKTSPTLATITRLAKAVGVSVAELMK